MKDYVEKEHNTLDKYWWNVLTKFDEMNFLYGSCLQLVQEVR